VYELGNGSDHFLYRLLPPCRGPNADPWADSFKIIEKEPLPHHRGPSNLETAPSTTNYHSMRNEFMLQKA
jgi:hypothetical protein